MRLTFVALVIAPLLTLSLQPLLRKLRKGHRRLRGDYGEITSVLQEVVSGVRLVKSFRGEPYEDRRFIGGERPLLVGHGAHHARRRALAADDGDDRHRPSPC